MRLYVFYKSVAFFLLICLCYHSKANNGYGLWLNYKPLPSNIANEKYGFIQRIYSDNAFNDEVGLTAQTMLMEKSSIMLSRPLYRINDAYEAQIILRHHEFDYHLLLNDESFLISEDDGIVYIEATSSKGLLYGVFHLLNRMHIMDDIRDYHYISTPKIQHRILNHWDNLDGTIERGYAGFSIWNWHELPDIIDKRYEDYAIANASIGINGAVLTNVNAKALVLRSDYLTKTAAVANVLRKYNIKVFLTARFNAPMELGNLPTADPMDVNVQLWWKNKIEEIYKVIPDFGGFVVKANSEGQPGPQDYGRSHADGANLFAKYLLPYGGIVMWRAFVYQPDSREDRFKQAYIELAQLDGRFLPNVIIQVKNGPIDFQPREPIHPLFGSMKNTPMMLELPITKEYLGQATHLVGMATMYEEILHTKINPESKKENVARIIDGSAFNHTLTGIAGVSNIGSAFNWTGHFFGQADWYAFGRMAWDPDAKADIIFQEWINATFSASDDTTQKTILAILLKSYGSCVKYMTPLGLHHIMAEGHHYGPGPWVDSLARSDWTAVYYHKADKNGIGYDRTDTGSNALSLYHTFYADQFSDVHTCPDSMLLWFHHVSWHHTMQSGRSLWQELIYQYDKGVEEVESIRSSWLGLKGKMDEDIFRSVAERLNVQVNEAHWWRDACLAYFQSRSMMPFPADVKAPVKPLSYYRGLSHPFAPGLKPKW